MGCNDADIYMTKAVMFSLYVLLGLSDSIEIGIHQSFFHEENPSLLAVSLLERCGTARLHAV